MPDLNSSGRLTIAGMLWGVALVALWLASLRSSSVVFTMVAATLTLAALLTAVLGAVYSTGPARAFWLGFALFGGFYLVLVNSSWVGGDFGHALSAGMIDWAEQVIPPPTVVIDPSSPAVAFDPTLAASKSQAQRAIQLSLSASEAQAQRSIKTGNFVEIGRMTMALGFALLGGLIGRRLAARSGEWSG